jgi:hypothetical protein
VSGESPESRLIGAGYTACGSGWLTSGLSIVTLKQALAEFPDPQPGPVEQEPGSQESAHSRAIGAGYVHSALRRRPHPVQESGVHPGLSFLNLLDHFTHGRPVVATPLPDAVAVADHGLIHLAEGPEACLAALTDGLANPKPRPNERHADATPRNGASSGASNES